MKHRGCNKHYQARQSREIFLQIEMLYHYKSLRGKGYGNRKKHLLPLAETTHKSFEKWVGKQAFSFLIWAPWWEGETRLESSNHANC